MPIKHFDTYLQDRKQIHALPLAHLSDTRLGIDACYYLHTLIAPPSSNSPGPSASSSSFNPTHAPSTSTSSVASIPVLPPSAREPLLAATGGLPLALTQRIEADLRVLEKLRIKPVFVFPGLVPCGSGGGAAGGGNTPNTGSNKRWRNQQGQMPGMQPFGGGIGMDPLIFEACRDRRDAWAKYEQGYEDAATRLFEGRSGIGQWDLWRMVLRIFRHRNVEFLVAPYVAWAQLVYLQRHPKAYIHAIYGPTDVLLYHGVDRLVTSLDLYSPSPSFQYTSKRSVLGDLGLTEDQFLDVGILLGSDASPHPSYSSSHPSHSHSHPQSHPNHNQHQNSNALAAYSAYSFTYPHVPTPSFPPTVHDQALKATIDLIKYYKTGHGAICAFDHPAVKGPGGVGPGGGGAGGMGGAGGSGAYLELFARARSVVRFGLVMGSEGTVGPLPLALGAVGVNVGGGHAGHPQGHQGQHSHSSQPITPSDIPQDLHEIFTHRLSEEVYFYLSRGLLSPHSLLWLTTGVITEYPPLDNGETTEYKRFVKEVVTEGQTGPRATALAVLCAGLGGWWGGNASLGGSSGNNSNSSNSNAGGNSGARKVSGWFWFEQQQGQQGQGGQGGGGGGQQGGGKLIMHNSPQTVQLAERVAGWNVSYAVIEDELRRQNSSTIDFALCLGATATDRLAARTKIKNSAVTPLEKKDEVVANVIWRFLELRGFLLNTHAHSPLARAMFSSISMAKLNDKFQDPLYIFLELVRAGVMHGHLWSGRAFSGGPSFGTDEEKSSMLLIMRVLSIVPLNFKPLPWSAPLSRELLVFNSFIRSLTRALRTLLEVTALNMLLRGDGKRGRDDLLDVALSLPFQGEVNTGFGVLAKVYLDALTHLNGGVRVRREDLEREAADGGHNGASAGTVRAMKEMALEVVEETFGGGVKYPKMEVERGFRFWDLALNAMRLMFKEGAVMRELMDQFEAAEAWLAPMRP